MFVCIRTSSLSHRFRQKILFVSARALARHRLAFIYGAECRAPSVRYGQSLTVDHSRLDNVFAGDGGIGDSVSVCRNATN